MFGPELIKNILPKSIRPLLDLVGPSFFKAIPWRDLSARGKIILAHLAGNDSAQRSLAGLRLTELLVGHPVRLTSDQHEKLSINDTTQKRLFGEAILELYFLQLKNEQGMFLDLRAQRFSEIKKELYFTGSNLWIQMPDFFRKSLLDLYQGFYQSDAELFDRALTNIGLMNVEMTSDQKKEIRDLFLQYFGDGQQDEVQFSTEKFVRDFENIFRFIIDHKLKISADFLYLGIYLASLFHNLQSLGIPLNVRESYRKAMKE